MDTNLRVTIPNHTFYRDILREVTLPSQTNLNAVGWKYKRMSMKRDVTTAMCFNKHQQGLATTIVKPTTTVTTGYTTF